MIKRYFPILVLLLAFVFLGACTDAPSLNAVSSNDVTGLIIKNQDGEALGTVEDVVMDLESGRIRYVIMEFSPDGFSYTKAAFVPNAANRTAVPLEVVQRDAETADFILTIEESILHEAPRLTADLDTLTEEWDAPVRAYWQEKLN
jgi:sporulation protein YlmC with PRC-barrel domain